MSTKARRWRWPTLLLAFAGAGSLAACTGEIGVSPAEEDPGARSEPAAGGSPVPRGSLAPGTAAAGGDASAAASAVCKGDGVTVGAGPVRRLTRKEYDNTIADLLRLPGAAARDFVQDGTVGIFRNNASAPVTALIASQYMESAEALAARSVQMLDGLLPCRPASGSEDACARQFVTVFGKRAYRRPLSVGEVNRLFGVYAAARARGHDFGGGIRVLLQGMLQSPHFLNHVEKGTGTLAPGGKAVSLTQHEIASRLSYLLWKSMPDQALFEAADAGKLGTAAGVQEQAVRMLKDARTRRGVLGFYDEWLELEKVDRMDKSEKIFPEFNDDLRKHLRAETEAFINHVLWEGDARLATLLTAPFSFVNRPLAKLYGLAAAPATDLLVRAEMPAERRGLLAHASLLGATAHAAQTSPVFRGKLVRERLLCQETPSPPDKDPDGNPVDTSPPRVDSRQTTRQRYATHLEKPFCAGCHRLLNPIGFGFERYDALGRHRTAENGQPIDASGEIVDSRDIDGAFDGVPALAERLARSRQVSECVAREWLAYGVGRELAAEDACSAGRIDAELAAPGANLRDLLLSIVRSDAFRYRPVVAKEVCP